MAEETPENQRKHFRIDYPKPDRPTLIFDRYKLEVLDLAEMGVKFACDGKFKPKEKHPILGSIKFKDGKEVPVSGTVLRYDVERDMCVVTFIKGIPYPKMMEEHMAIIRKYQAAKK